MQNFAEEFAHDHENYIKIFDHNREFIEEKLRENPDYFKQLSKGQTPRYLVIGCSDSRVPPNEITKLKAGDIFNHRNIANQVIPADLNVNSVIQYAVDHLKVKHVIVMGHTACGGVRAALEGNSFGGMLDLWLCQLKNVYEKYQDFLDEIQDINERTNKLSEYNVVEQVMNVWKNPYIQKSWKKGHPVWVHGWIFRVDTGILDEILVEKGLPQEIKAHHFHFNEYPTAKEQPQTSIIASSPSPIKSMKIENDLVGRSSQPRNSQVWKYEDYLHIQSELLSAELHVDKAITLDRKLSTKDFSKSQTLDKAHNNQIPSEDNENDLTGRNAQRQSHVWQFDDYLQIQSELISQELHLQHQIDYRASTKKLSTLVINPAEISHIIEESQNN